jgi:hypothetical protein
MRSTGRSPISARRWASTIYPKRSSESSTRNRRCAAIPWSCGDGLNDRESASLLRFLFSESVRPATVYRHHWRMGDLIIWDELATLHIGPDTFAPERQLVRIYGGLTTPTAARNSPQPSREAVPA